MAGSYMVTVTEMNGVSGMVVSAVVMVLANDVEWVVFLPVVMKP
jgi:hypothetical protein